TATVARLDGRRLAIGWRAAADGVREEDLLAGDAQVLEDAHQNNSRRADERLALAILVPSRRLPDQAEDRVQRSAAEDGAAAALAQRVAAGAGGDTLRQVGQGGGALVGRHLLDRGGGGRIDDRQFLLLLRHDGGGLGDWPRSCQALEDHVEPSRA